MPDKDEAEGIPWPLPLVLSPEQAMQISRALLVDVTLPPTQKPSTATPAPAPEPSPSPTVPFPAAVPLPTKLRFLHVRDGYVSYDQIASVKVEQVGAQPIKIIVVTAEGGVHLWSETFKDRALADLACDRIVWALGL